MYIIGITGGSGSGKTTFAKRVANRAEGPTCSILHMDSYYSKTHSPEVITGDGSVNFDHPASFDWKLLRNHLTELKKGNPIEAPIYDFATHSRTQETVAIGPCDVLLFEGIFSLYDQDIRELLDVKCFLQVDADIRFTRRLHRDVKERGRSLEGVIAQYYDTVRPMYQKYLDPQRQYADFIVGEETAVAADILAAHISKVAAPQDSISEQVSPSQAGIELQ